METWESNPHGTRKKGICNEKLLHRSKYLHGNVNCLI